MASRAVDDGEAVLVFGDEFIADEILARLPARCAVRCTLLSKRFRKLLASSHFWDRHRSLGAPLELPHAARLNYHSGGNTFDFHVAGPAFAMKHTVHVQDPSSYASTCNGLVLLSGISCTDKGQSSSVDGVLFNPATKEELRLSLQLPPPHHGKEDLERRILGFGYGPSSNAYKALVREDDYSTDDSTTRLMVVTFGGGGGQEPREVLSCPQGFPCNHSLYTPGDGKLYFLIYDVYFTAQQQDKWEATSVLAFDIDDEVATSVALPEGSNKSISITMMLQIRGRPCVYKKRGQDTVIWSLTPDHRWEQLYVLLLKESSPPDDYLVGAWDCGGGLLFAVFRATGAYLYNLHEGGAEAALNKQQQEGGVNRRLTAVSSLEIDYEWPEPLRKTMWLDNPANLLDYRPTLISPASIFGDADALSGHQRESADEPTHESLDEMFLEMTQKLIVDPAVQMLTNL